MRTMSMALMMAALTLSYPAARAQGQSARTAIVGGTIVDGNGGPPIADGVVPTRLTSAIAPLRRTRRASKGSVSRSPRASTASSTPSSSTAARFRTTSFP